MSGHSRWSQIKHRKEVSDQKKGQVFSKLANKITIAARGGADPSTNYKLQSAIDEARAVNMPKENIERAIKRVGEKEAASLNEIIIQAIGPGSAAVVIEAVTNNKNRTIAEIKNVLTKNDFRMVPEGSLNWMFGKDWTPKTPLEVGDLATRQKFDKLLEELAASDDVENVHSNLR
jgi:YebC/PmpR family DNA-binding regulatory protein